MTRFEAPRGTHDILPSEQPLWQWVTGQMEVVCALYGYRRIDPPGIEDTELDACDGRLRHRGPERQSALAEACGVARTADGGARFHEPYDSKSAIKARLRAC